MKKIIIFSFCFFVQNAFGQIRSVKENTDTASGKSITTLPFSRTYNKGVDAMKMENYKSAILYFNSAIFENRKDIDALYNRGIAYIKLSDTANACSDWQTGFRFGDKDAKSMFDKYCGKFKSDTSKTFNDGKGEINVKPAEFPGGEANMLIFLKKNIRYPVEAKSQGIKGRVYATFVVTMEGKVTNGRILKGIGGGCEEEVLRVLRLMPEWTPAQIDGRPTDMDFNLPVNFNF